MFKKLIKSILLAHDQIDYVKQSAFGDEEIVLPDAHSEDYDAMADIMCAFLIAALKDILSSSLKALIILATIVAGLVCISLIL